MQCTAQVNYIQPFQGDCTIYTGVGRPYGGFPDFGYLDQFRPQAPCQLLGTQSGNFGPTPLGYSALGQVMIATNNTTVVSYINKQEETHSHSLLRLVVDLFLWLQSQDIILRGRHIPGCLNVIADGLSRANQPITTEWSLHPKIMIRIFGTWGTPTVDIFATVHSAHLPQFMSPMMEPRSLAINALSQDWQGAVYMYVHVPPFSLLNKVIQKLQATQKIILIAPWWPSQPWFEHLLRLCVDYPPHQRDLLFQAGFVSDGKSYHLHAWRPSCNRIFKRRVKRVFSRQLLEGPQTACMTICGSLHSLFHRSRN